MDISQHAFPQAPTAEERDALAVVGSVVEASGDAAILLDGDMRCLCFSPQFATLIGMRGRTLTRELEAASSFLELFEQIDIEQSTLTHSLEHSSRVCLYDVAGKNSQGEGFIVLVSIVPVLGANKRAFGLVCTLREVTAEVGLQRSFRELLIAEQKRSGELETLIDARTAELRSALAEVTEHANALGESKQREIALQKSVFAGRLATGLAHEFNSPLACVLANQAYLKSRVGEVMASGVPLPAQVIELCNEVQEILGEDNVSLNRLSATIGSLQGFSLSSDPSSDDIGPPPLLIVDVMRDVQIALAGTGIDQKQIEFGDVASCEVSAYRAEVSIALVSLMQYILDFDAAESARQSGERESVCSDDSVEARRIQVRGQCEDSSYLIEIACDEFIIDVNDAESAFDPSLVVGEGSRVKLSLDLSMSAARIARSGGTLQCAKSETGGSVIEVRLVRTAAQKD